MELGNMLFGNSRGNFRIERHLGFENVLLNLFDLVALDSYGYPNGITNRLLKKSKIGMLENNTFSVFPYYWGDCTCGYADKERQWGEENGHEEGCYQTSYTLLTKHYGFLHIPKKEVIKLYEKHDIAYDKEDPMRGSAVVCTCSYKDKWARFVDENDHSSTCPIVLPNFIHKRSGLKIQWYKYPFRDAYSNVELTLETFSKIINECIKSLKEEKDV